MSIPDEQDESEELPGTLWRQDPGVQSEARRFTCTLVACKVGRAEGLNAVMY